METYSWLGQHFHYLNLWVRNDVVVDDKSWIQVSLLLFDRGQQ